MPNLAPAQLKAALFYYGKYRSEVDAEIAENEAEFEALRGDSIGVFRRA